jgi:hypothetical protein
MWEGSDEEEEDVKMSLSVIAAVLFGVLGCGISADGDSTYERENVRSDAKQVRPVRWKVYGPPTGRRVRIISEVGYCAGTEIPRIKAVHVVEKARRVLLTAILSEAEVGPGGCAGVSRGIKKVVRLERPLGKRDLYDASLSPPAIRWPHS